MSAGARGRSSRWRLLTSISLIVIARQRSLSSLGVLEVLRLDSNPLTALPPLSGRCFNIDGRVVIAAPERAESLEREGRPSTDCMWQPGSPSNR